MAKKWVDRLSLAQLQKISRLSEDLVKERSQGSLTAVRFVERVRATDDPEVVSVVTSSAASCALGA